MDYFLILGWEKELSVSHKKKHETPHTCVFKTEIGVLLLRGIRKSEQEGLEFRNEHQATPHQEKDSELQN